MRHHDRNPGTGHTLKEHGIALQYLNHDDPRLKLTRFVGRKMRPMLRARDQFLERRHHLAAVADPQCKNLLAGEKGRKLLAHRGFKQNRLGPTLPCAEDIPKGKTAAGCKTLKIPEVMASLFKIRHRHIHRCKSRPVKSRGHLHVAINTLLSQDGDPWPGATQDRPGRRIVRRIKCQNRTETRI